MPGELRPQPTAVERYFFTLLCFSIGLSLRPIPVVVVGRIMMALFGPAIPH